MSAIIGYFSASNSPRTSEGHQRLTDLAQAHGATVRVMPVDLGQVFSVSPTRLTGAAVWVQERNIADEATLTRHLAS